MIFVSNNSSCAIARVDPVHLINAEQCTSLFRSHSRSGDGSPPRSSPGSSISVLGRFDSGDLAMTPAAPGRVLDGVTPDVLPSHQHHCSVDKWRSLDVRCGAGRPPTMENGPCAVAQLGHRDALVSGPVMRPAMMRMLHVGKYLVDTHVWIAAIQCTSGSQPLDQASQLA